MPDDRDLRSVLHDEADRHSPDRGAMLDRINQRRGSAPNRLMSLFRPVEPGPRRILNVARPVAAAVAVAGLLVAGVTGINLAGQQTVPPPAPQAAASPPPVPTSPAPYSPAPSSSAPSASASSSAPPKKPRLLTATGSLNRYSIDNWGQSDLVVDTTGTITKLDVTVRIARTPGLLDTGHWTSVPNELITSSVSTTGSAFVYRFTLKAGATLAPGSYTFATQYNHSAGTRSMAADSYEVTATAGKKTRLTGGYTA
ncbi:hypothetical protein BJ973_009216 [Actinoplanes tereljensis]|uniref:Uncharacterized protein n=1 Tax=Paractinoplanes tereljensis TaxID=571912 RepID=A0A919NGN9_9ACTN|nr:hypothetical protein [Actinoplanes tereljensis]GIF17820.1 hypothetical protein Ate02nite_05500 [Actinoplanes tereljensis]